jgi:hypothetical protein
VHLGGNYQTYSTGPTPPRTTTAEITLSPPTHVVAEPHAEAQLNYIYILMSNLSEEVKNVIEATVLPII